MNDVMQYTKSLLSGEKGRPIAFQKNCVVCGRTFYPQRNPAQQQYCSNGCRQKGKRWLKLHSNAQRREYYKEHKDKLRASSKAYCEKHKDEIIIRSKAYYEKHKDEKKAYYERHKDYYKEYHKRYYQIDDNKEKRKLYNKRYRQSERGIAFFHSEKRKAYNQTEKAKAYRKAYDKARYIAKKESLLELI